MADQASLQPDKLTKYLQLPAAWLLAGILLASAFTGGALSTDQSSLRWILGLSAPMTALLTLAAAFLLQTVFRPQLQEDKYYSEWRKNQEQRFRGFEPENLRRPPVEVAASNIQPSFDELERKRIEIYEANKGLFLTHSWRPSKIPDQVADIVVSLRQHGTGPLTYNKVRSVEYHLGPKFFEYPVVKTDPNGGFPLDVSAYAPMLCLARIEFNDDSPPIEIDRYIDFDVESTETDRSRGA